MVKNFNTIKEFNTYIIFSLLLYTVLLLFSNCRTSKCYWSDAAL